MRKLIFILGIVVFAACNSGNNKNAANTEDSSEGPGTAYDITPVWTYEYDSATKDNRMKKLRELSKEERSAGTLVMILNTINEGIHMNLVKTSNDTMYVAIPDSKVLTQQMGSEGATQYMATATYTLTEMTGIKYVHFDFEEGDHAEPGTYSREQFSKGF